jgi:hypothetical protein
MAKTGRNDLCHCGSGRKYKKCCEGKERGGAANGRMLVIVVGAAVAAALVAGVLSFTGERTARTTRVWDPVHGHYHDANGVAVP